ncbi:hypothetical protein ABVT39_019213, partial [Epinephelus coioides]
MHRTRRRQGRGALHLRLLMYTYDMDGVVMHIRHMGDIFAVICYLNLPRGDASRLKRQYSYLKKHVYLPNCSPEGLTALKNCLGQKIADVAGGYVLTLCAVPSSLTEPDFRLQNPSLYGRLAAELLREVTEEFGRLLNDLPQMDMSRPTVQKQGTTNLGSFRVLRVDQPFILSLLDQAVEKANSCCFLKVIATLGQFGQRDPDILQVNDLVAPSSVVSISVHLAVKVLAVREDTHLLFSRYGLLSLVGARGSLFSTQGMHETCNFQSNLNTLIMDIGHTLKSVLSKTGRVTFLQLYADAPHIHYSQPFKHAVSGVLVTCGLSHPNFKTTLTSRAHTYLRHIRDLSRRLVCQVGCRIEQVARFEGHDLPLDFNPRDFFDLSALQKLFLDYPLLVPFQDREDSQGLLSTLRGVVNHLAGILGQFLRDSEGVGRYDPSWTSFQAELALEELFFEHALSVLDNTLSASLGTSTVNERSASHEGGFIGLAPHNSASLEESPPPVHHWTKDSLQKTRIERLWALCQCVEAGPAVLGAALIRVLLGDLYKRNDQLPWTSFKSDTSPGRLTGAIDVKKLAEDLATKDSFPVPHTFSRARALTLQVFSEIERRSLCFSKHLEVYREHGMPWMATALQRLPKQLMGGLLINTLTFICCVALIQNGAYIDFVHLKDLLQQMSLGGMSQARLQQLLIQGKFTLDKVRNVRIWSLHPTIPYRLEKRATPMPSLRPPPSEVTECVQPLEDVQAVDDQDGITPAVVSAAMCLPANFRQKWSTDEESCVSKQSQVALATFRAMCWTSSGIAILQFATFRLYLSLPQAETHRSGKYLTLIFLFRWSGKYLTLIFLFRWSGKYLTLIFLFRWSGKYLTLIFLFRWSGKYLTLIFLFRWSGKYLTLIFLFRWSGKYLTLIFLFRWSGKYLTLIFLFRWSGKYLTLIFLFRWSGKYLTLIFLFRWSGKYLTLIFLFRWSGKYLTLIFLFRWSGKYLTLIFLFRWSGKYLTLIFLFRWSGKYLTLIFLFRWSGKYLTLIFLFRWSGKYLTLIFLFRWSGKYLTLIFLFR